MAWPVDGAAAEAGFYDVGLPTEVAFWPLLLTTAAKIAVEEASAELGRIVEYDIDFAPLVSAVEGEEEMLAS